MTTILHDEAVWACAGMFGRWGYPVAREAGIPGGRADLVVFDKNTRRPAYVVEVKTGYQRDHFAVIRVLEYARWFNAVAVLALALGESTDLLRRRAKEYGVQLLECDFASIIAASATHGLADVEWIDLPYHVSSLDVAA